MIAQSEISRSNEQMIQLLHDRGFFLERGKWSKIRKTYLATAMETLQENIELAKANGSVESYLANKCGVTIEKLLAQVEKYHLKKFQALKAQFKSRYEFDACCFGFTIITRFTSRNAMFIYMLLYELCLCYIHRFGTERIASIHQNIRNVYSTMLSLDKQLLYDIFRPGKDGIGDVKLFDEYTLSTEEIANVTSETIQATAQTKKLQIPCDVTSTSTTNAKILHTIKKFLSQYDGKECKDWDWTEFMTSLGMSYQQDTVNCMKYYIWHCICKPKSKREINMIQYVWDSEFLKQATNNFVTCSTLSMQNNIELQGISSVSLNQAANILQLPTLDGDMIDEQDIQIAIKNANNDSLNMDITNPKMPNLENSQQQQVFEYGLGQKDFTSLNKMIQIDKSTENVNSTSESNKSEVVKKNDKSDTKPQRSVKMFKFDKKSKTVAMMGTFETSEKKKLVKKAITDMKGKISQRFGKKTKIYVVGTKTKKSASLVSIANEYRKPKTDIMVVKAQYILDQKDQSHKIVKTTENSSKYFWTQHQIVKFCKVFV